jgi:hypothetical protein
MEEAYINNFMLPSLWLDYTDKPTIIKSLKPPGYALVAAIAAPVVRTLLIS